MGMGMDRCICSDRKPVFNRCPRCDKIIQTRCARCGNRIGTDTDCNCNDLVEPTYYSGRDSDYPKTRR